MIKSTDFYPRYIARLNKVLDAQTNKIELNASNLETVKETLTTNSSTLHDYCKVELADLLEDKKCFDRVDSVWFEENQSTKYVETLIRRQWYYENEIVKARKAFDKYRKFYVDRTTFYEIYKRFNGKMFTELIENSYEWKPVSKFGIIRVGLSKNKGKWTDWQKSKENKQAILDKGAMPYHKDTAPNGEKWLVHFKGDYAPFVKWVKKSCSLPNKQLYTLKPADSTTNYVKQLYDYWRAHPEMIHKYQSYDR